MIVTIPPTTTITSTTCHISTNRIYFLADCSMTSNTTRVPSIPRPPPSPLRSGSVATPIPSHNSSSSSGAPVGSSAARRTSASSTPPPPVQKTRARDLLRKHYGLGVGPPPPRPGTVNSQDPMDLSERESISKLESVVLIVVHRFPCIRRKKLL